MNNLTTEVVDITGRTVAQIKLNQANINVNLNLASGKYFLKFQNKNGSQVKSFIIQK
jgi:hypothetical protein